MALLQEWREYAYSEEMQNSKEGQKLWENYFTLEKGIYEKLLANPSEIVEGTVQELADRYEVPLSMMVGFLDGINDSLKEANPIDEMEKDTKVKLDIDLEKLYYNMVECKAEWLYTLPQWNDILPEDKRKELYKKQKNSGTIHNENRKVGRNRSMQDMTEGRPISLILKFFFPLLFGMLFQQFYNLVDTAIVGKFLGPDDLAAVGATGSVNFLILGFCMGVCNGFSIPVAQKFGAKDESGLRRFVANSVWLSVIFAAVMTVVVCILCRQILIWMDTPANILEGSYRYIFVIFLGIPVTYLYNLLSGIMRALGDSKTPLIFLILSSVLNIVFDLGAILILHMGVAGAAWATVTAQGISGVLCLIYMKKKYTILKISKDEWKLNGSCIARLCGMGIPMGLQY